LEEEVATLGRLGLTTTQAKVLLALVNSGASNIQEISDTSKVHRTDIYRIVKDLEEEGLVEREIATPVKFKAIPLNECFDRLFEKKDRERSETYKQAARLIRSYREKNQADDAEGTESHSWIIPGGRVKEKIGQAIDSVNESLTVVLPWKRFSSGFSVVFSDKIEKALSRKVKLRFAVALSGNGEYPVNKLDSKKNNPFCEIRFFRSTSCVVLGIYDQTEVSISEFPDVQLEKAHILWSTNKALLALARNYCEMIWTNATKEPPQSKRIEEKEN